MPAERAQWNAYQLSERQGFPWSPDLDAHVSRCGGELLGHGELICVDCDAELLIDGTTGTDGFRWLADAAVRAGYLLDVTTCLSVRTPGHPHNGHAPGMHLWFRADPERPVRYRALAQCKFVEIKSRGTCPGSPGYTVLAAPEELPALPGWLAELAGPPPKPRWAGKSSGCVEARLTGIITRLLSARQPGRNDLLHWSALRCAEMIAAGELDAATAWKVLTPAALEIGLAPGEIAATIASGLKGAAK